MSLLMQALKKAEHAKQKQAGGSATDAPQDNTASKEQNENIALTPKEADKTSSDGVSPDLVGLELSPIAAAHTEPARAEPVSAEQEFLPAASSLSKNFTEPMPMPAPSASSDNLQYKQNTFTEKPRFENENTSSAEPISQQLAAKNKLEQQKAAALEYGKVLAEQQKAKTVFSSKEPSRNRRAVWLGVSGLIVVALFIGAGYYYLSIAPQGSSLMAKSIPIQTNPVAATEPVPNAVNTVAPPSDASPVSSAPLPAAAPNLDARSGVAAASIAPKAVSPKTDDEAVTQRPKKASTTGAETIQFRQTTVDSHVNPTLSSAYQSFVNGDMGSAQQQYQTVLQQEPNNRDALLGLAAIALNRKQSGQAGSFYVRLLELDPADPDAIAGITSLQGGDPSQIESRLKKVLAQNPQAGAVLFALGNLYAQQSRWSDAQQSYFRAYGTTPTNADYAFNLAVSLDRLNQEKLALDFYQRALSLAQKRPGAFNNAGVQDRINELQTVK